MTKTIMIGAVAYDSKVVPIWEGIREYFINEGVPLDFVLFSNYETQVEAMFSRFIDIAWNTNLAFVKADRRLNGRSKMLAMRDTDLAFTSKIIVRTGCGITTLEQLRNKNVAFGSADSAQAAIMPEFYLKKAGLKRDVDYTAIAFNTDVGKHGDTGASENEVIEALLSGAADAGAVGETTWLRMANAGSAAQLQSIWTSPPYSHCNFTALPDLDEGLASQFQDKLMKMDYNNPKHRPILEMEGLKRWVKGDRAGYAAVFDAVDETGYLKQEVGAGVAAKR